MQLKNKLEYQRHNMSPAFHKLCGINATKATIHHADFSRHNVLGKAGIEDDDETIVDYLYQWHHIEQGWKNGIGYHAAILPDGRFLLLYRGIKGIDGAHVRDHNSNNIGILVWGDFEGDEFPTKEQEATIKAVRLLLEGICGIENFYLHSDFNNHATSCPGKNFPVELWKP